jgi:two-component system CheB/CheR fusion protein
MVSAEQFPVVGIGASAGGVEALQGLFRAMPDPPPAAAFVVVTHLGPGHVSALPSILSECTAMPVLAARDGDALRPGIVQVLPTDGILTVADGRLQIRPQEPDARRERQPIDVFLASLAEDQGERAAGIVLSGTGTDGTLGLKAIKEQGGLTLAQGIDGSVPRYPNMPASAVASGAVDLLVPVEEMPARLDEFARSFTASGGVAEEERRSAETARRKAAKEAICGVLRERVGHDFSGYKDGTFFRRVQRRIQVLRLTGGLDAYLAHLHADEDEAGLLFRDLLIGVTGFFRDPSAFTALQKSVLPALLEGRNAEDTVRVWVPGCATGEEAYSLAILLHEALETIPKPPRVQIFATDIDDAALGVARSGRYPAQLLASVPPERLQRHFVFDGITYTVAKPLRDLCVFSSHSVVRDAPFSRIDLVSCRNLLIYLGGHLQDQVLPLFHYALRPSGFLFLGVSEMITQHAELFTPEDKAHRIFRRRQHVSPLGTTPALLMRVGQTARGTAARPWPAPLPAPRPRPTASLAAELRAAVGDFVLEHLSPAHLVVSQDGDVLYQSAHLGKYLEPATGAPSRQLFAMARRGLRLELRAALREAVETRRRAVRPRVEVQVEDRRQLVSLVVAPLPLRDAAADPLFVVAFTDLGPPTPAATAGTATIELGAADDPAVDAARLADLVAQLEREMRDLREQLQNATEEYETATEELKAANEEMVSVNEELQSTNEELETSKEELHSVNEELRTVNLELSEKVESLDRANADLRNLFDSTQVATVFLDRHLVIRSFTPATTAIFHLMPGDLGRPLTHFASRLEGVDMRAETRRVLESQEMHERRVTTPDGATHYLMRLLPYRTAQGAVDGVVATFLDVTKVVEGEVLGTLVDELNHRVRNMLQVVQAVAAHTLRRTPLPKEFARVFRGRILALARAHELVSVGGWGDVPLDELVRKELGPYAEGPGRLAVEGQPLRLKPKAALALGMVLHELATNAAKHGALSALGGRVTVSWMVEGGGEAARLMLRWVEQGGPPVVDHPDRRGFGSELIERQVRHDMQGTVELIYEPSGLRATLALPEGVISNFHFAGAPGAAPGDRLPHHP